MALLLSVLFLCFCNPVQARLFENTGPLGTLDFELDGAGSELGTLTSNGCTEAQGYRSCEYYLYDGPTSNQLMNYKVTVTPAQSDNTPNTWVRFYSQETQSGHADSLLLTGKFFFYFHYPNPGDVNLTIDYWGSPSGTNLEIVIHFVYDSDYFNSIFFHSYLLGGQHDNINTKFLHEGAKAGPPILAQRNTRGSGPGVMSKFGVPRYWINSATLNAVVEHPDYSYKGLGPDVAMTRTYNADPSDVGMFGNGWHFAYESEVLKVYDFSAAAPTYLTKGSGQQRQFVPSSSSSNVYIENPPSGKDDRLTYNSSGDYWILETKDNHLQYRYEGCSTFDPDAAFWEWKLVSITDANGNKLTINRDPTTCAISSITDAAGRTTTFAYDSSNHCVSMTVPNGLATNYAYVGGNLASSTNVMGVTTSYSYDSNNYLTSMIVAGKTTTFSYSGGDMTKKISGVVDALDHSQTFSMDSATGNVTAVDFLGNQSVYMSSDGKTTGTTDSLSYTTARSYSDIAHIVSFTDANKKSTGLSYDGQGNLAKISMPQSETYATPHDGSDNLIGITDPLHEAMTVTYDGNHNPTALTTPKGEKNQMGYDGSGLMTSSTDANLHTRTLGYDGFGNNTSITDATGYTSSRTFDAHGFTKTSATDALGNTIQFAYDNNQRLVKVTYPDGNSTGMTYDCCSLTASTDENGHTTSYTRNALLNITGRTDPMGNTTSYGYDANNNVTQITDANGKVSKTTYDALDRPVTTTDALGGKISRAYDPNWNVTSTTDQRGHKTHFTYDANNRLASITDPLGNKETFTRDTVGRIVTAAGEKGHIDFVYDKNGAMLQKSYDGSLVYSYSYDPAGNLIKVVDHPRSIDPVYNYDAEDRIAKITYSDGKALSITYNPVGSPDTIVYPNISVTYHYDNRNRVSRLEWAQDFLEGWSDFSYDGAGNLVGESRFNNTSSTYAYDGNNRVIEITHMQHVNTIAQIKYTRDAVGNITKEKVVTAPLQPVLKSLSERTTYNAANQIVQSGTDQYTYEGDGNLIDIVGNTHFNAAYDLENRPVSITRNGVTVTYTYDGNGNRVRSATGSKITNAHYDRSGRLMFETDHNGNVTACYIYNGSRLVAMRTSKSNSYYYHFDHTGSTTIMTDHAGKSVNAYVYSPFGEIQNSKVTIPNPFTYVGAFGVIDEGSGLYFMKNRYYDAVTGRFLQKDPTGTNGGANLYAYVGDNPVNRIDPAGANWIEDIEGWFTLKRSVDAAMERKQQRDAGYGGAPAQRMLDDMTKDNTPDKDVVETASTALKLISNTGKDAGVTAINVLAGGNLLTGAVLSKNVDKAEDNTLGHTGDGQGVQAPASQPATVQNNVDQKAQAAEKDQEWEKMISDVNNR
jgi:RHS repeat-associated protein